MNSVPYIGFEVLQDNEIRNIFKFLSTADRSSVSLVNKRFNEIFKSIRTWSIRKPVSYKNKASRIKGLANNIPVIKNIKINRADSKDVKLLAKKHPELASLEMHLGSLHTSLGMKCKLPKLRKLRISASKYNYYDLKISKMKAESLECLWLSNCILVDKNAIFKFRKLVSLKLIDCLLIERGFKFDYICKRLGEFGIRLSTLDLSHCLDIDDSSVEIIACSSLPATLENLNLSWTGLTDSSLAHLPVFSNLNTLAIAGSGSFSDEGFCSLDGNIMRNIRVVDVSFTSLSDEGVESLLSAYPGLQDINFSRNIKITDRSMHTIKKRVKHLKKLNVRETQVSDEGLELLRVFSELAFLNCSPGAISEETITMLQTSSPRLVLEARNEEDLEDEDDLPDLLSSDSDEESSGDE